jgi:phage terminase Nu1 subunit (DNA packaging protein)
MPKAAVKPVETGPVETKTVAKTTSRAPKSSKKKASDRAGSWIHPTCTKAELSILIGVSIRALADLDARGILVRAPKKGTYRTVPSIASYIKRLQETAAGRLKEGATPAAEERAARERVDRQISEIKLQQLKGEIITLAEASEAWSEFAGKVKASFLAIPSKIRSRIPHVTPHDAETIRDICRDELTDLAEEVKASVVSGDADAVAP